MLGDRIKLVRESNRLSQVEFGKILGISKQTVSNWENNNVQPSVDIIKVIALKFNTSSDFLLELDDRLHIYANKKLPIEIVSHIQNIINDILILYCKTEDNSSDKNSNM
ncbi:helix-turn-helix transcriptional regulator [Thomasclavelia cocleata]|uniref:helix-turn-helix transcriptional regulator n=1 Tax=Thomasclavelia cocleata TaxID=69824 RepID=UPI00272DD1B6|nr:helix-turn-helix transcriptional regulator [Thomasclavelia cocleata]